MLNKLNKNPLFAAIRPKLLALRPGGAAAVYKPADMPGEKYFLAAILVAVFLHLAALGVWSLLPKSQVIEVPVRPLNITLGNGDDAAAVLPPSNSHEVETAISSAVANQRIRPQSVSAAEKALEDIGRDATAAAIEAAIRNHTLPENSRVSDITYQFVRDTESAMAVPTGRGTKGDSRKNAEIVKRYERIIASWVLKFKQYPEQARAQNIEGDSVMRVRIDRRGNIRHYMLEHTTGSAELDHAAIEMIRRANPVPAVPNDYPDGELLEFFIPVRFSPQS